MDLYFETRIKYHRCMVHLILMNVKLVGIMSARCKAETSGIKLKQKRAPPWTDLGQGWGT